MPQIGESLPWAPDSIWDGSGWINRSLWTGANVNGNNPAAANAAAAEAYRTQNKVAMPTQYTPPMPTGNVLQAPSPQQPVVQQGDPNRSIDRGAQGWPAAWMPGGSGTPMRTYPGGYAGHGPRQPEGPVYRTMPYDPWGGWGGMPGGQQRQGPFYGTQPVAQQPRQRVPRPYHVNPMVWDSMGNVGQQLALGAAEQEGYDPDDWMRQLNESRPQGQAPRRVQTSYAQPRRF